MKHGYLIHATPSQEAIAQCNLERQGYQTDLPLAPVRRRRVRVCTRIGAMFACYLLMNTLRNYLAHRKLKASAISIHG